MTTAKQQTFLDLTISCKYISFLQDFVNLNAFKKNKSERIAKRRE
jgi:hypothetical protein